MIEQAIKAIQDGDFEAAIRELTLSLEEARAKKDVSTQARCHLALIGLARVMKDPKAYLLEMRALEKAAAANPGSELERALTLVRARAAAEKGDFESAMEFIRQRTLHDTTISKAVVADMIIAAARKKATDTAWHNDLLETVIAMAPLVTPDALEALFPKGKAGSAARRALEERRAGRPERATWLFIAAAIEMLRSGDFVQAIRHLKASRDESVRVPDAIAYRLSSMLLVLLYAAQGDRVNAMSTAMRALASLEDLLGPDAGAEFKFLLEQWRAAVGPKEFNSILREFIQERNKYGPQS